MLVDNEILQTTGTIRLKAEFPNTAHRLWPGELIDVWLLLDTRHNGLTVQASAVQQGQQGAFRTRHWPRGCPQRHQPGQCRPAERHPQQPAPDLHNQHQ
jgi:hypothetical protein